MNDWLLGALFGVLVALSVGLIKLCEHLQGDAR